jgi:hypothetical protein
MQSMRRVRALGLLTTFVIGVLAGVAGAAKGGGGGVAPPAAAATRFKSDLTAVALPACTGAETNTAARPGTCQTAAPLLFDPALGAIPIPAAIFQNGRARLHMPALDPAKFPVNGCNVEYHISSFSGTTPLIAAIAPEVGNIADFRVNAPAGSVNAGDAASIDVVCNFTGRPVTGRRGVIITPGAPIHTETHWQGVLA